MSRIHKLHMAFEYLFEAILCDAVVVNVVGSDCEGVRIEYRVRWWNPAAWVAWSRTVVFRDKVGCAFYR